MSFRSKPFSLMIIIATALFFISCEPEPIADFYSSKTAALTGEVIQFTSTSTDAYDFSWTFGDGATSSLENPTHTYTEAGNFMVGLTVQSKSGKSVSTSNMNITIEYANEIRYEGMNFPLTKAYLAYFGDWGDNDAYNFDLTLTSEGIISTQDSTWGNGELMILEMWSASPQFLLPGSYVYSLVDMAQSITYGGLAFNLDAATDTGDFYDVVAATAYVENIGLNSKFTITLLLNNGKEAKVYYTGPILAIFDYSDFRGNKKHSK
jgi:PKD repeat protein